MNNILEASKLLSQFRERVGLTDDFEKQLLEYSEKIKELIQEREEINALYIQENQKTARFREENKEFYKKQTELEEQLAKLKVQLREAEGSKIAQKEDYDRENNLLQKNAQKQLDELKEKHRKDKKAIVNDLSQEKDHMRVLREEISGLHTLKDQLFQKSALISEKYRDERDKNKENSQTIATLQSNDVRNQEELARKQAALEQLELELEQKQERLTELQTELQTALYTRQLNQNVGSGGERLDLMEDADADDEDDGEQVVKFSKEEELINNLKSEIIQLGTRIETIEKQRDDSGNKLEKAQGELKNLGKNLQEKDEKIELLRNENEDLKKQLKNITDSLRRLADTKLQDDYKIDLLLKTIENKLASVVNTGSAKPIIDPSLIKRLKESITYEMGILRGLNISQADMASFQNRNRQQKPNDVNSIQNSIDLITEMRTKVEELRSAQIKEIQEKTETLQSQVQAANNKVVEQQRALAVSEGQVQEFQSRSQRLESENAVLRQQLKDASRLSTTTGAFIFTLNRIQNEPGTIIMKATRYLELFQAFQKMKRVESKRAQSQTAFDEFKTYQEKESGKKSQVFRMGQEDGIRGRAQSLGNTTLQKHSKTMHHTDGEEDKRNGKKQQQSTQVFDLQRKTGTYKINGREKRRSILHYATLRSESKNPKQNPKQNPFKRSTGIGTDTDPINDTNIITQTPTQIPTQQPNSKLTYVFIGAVNVGVLVGGIFAINSLRKK
jgi:chromosome segregation ATPase